MSPTSQKDAQSSSFDLSNLVSAEMLLVLATGPLLAGLVGSKVLMEMMQELGRASEEVFRGDRLPILNLPTLTEDSH